MEKIYAADLTSSKSICEGLPMCNTGDPGKSFGDLFSKGVNMFLIVGALIAIFYLMWAGINWIQSEGDKEKLAKARLKMTQAIIGLLILFSVWTIWVLIVTTFGIFKTDGNGGVQFTIPSLVK
jgi:cytochrome bd-type quinol oxidase subunit 2